MIKLIPELRRPWSDGLAPSLGLEDYRDPHEHYFGLFGGGDGGGNGGGDSEESTGTTFGVDGVSATGSTAQDAAIGYTSSEGSGEAGANFGGLSGATSSQVANAVAAAEAAQEAGGGLGTQQAAAGLSLAGQSPAVAAASAISDAQATQAQIAAAQATPDELSVEPFSSSFAPTLSTQIDDAIMAEDIAGEYGVVSPDFSSLQSAPGTGLGSFTAPSARGVLGSTQPNTGIASLAAQQVGQQLAQDELSVQPFSGSTNLSGLIDEAVAAEDEFGAYGVTPTGQSLANQGMPYSSPVRDAEGNYTINGVPVDKAYAQQVIAEQAQAIEAMPSPSAGLVGNILGYTGIGKLGEVLTGKTAQQRAAETYGTMLAMPGAQVDAAGNITAPAGSGTLNYSQTMGGVTYSGMPDPGYSGPFANLVNPPADMGDRAGDRVLTQAVVADPCPEGYELVDGVCQPVGDVDLIAPPPPPPDTRFTLPTVPLTFSPVTQETQVGQINPFVLSPTGTNLG